MSIKKFLPAILLFLYCGRVSAQNNFTQTDAWLADHTSEMGGRTILMVYQNGHVIYSHTINNMSTKQKYIYSYIAKKQGKTADIDDFGPAVRQPVASCCKWFSAALVMTFVDEGKLRLTDTIGKYLPILSQHGKGNITISQCLSHLTGIKAPELKENISEMKDISSMDEAITKIANMPMEGTPGKVFHYSSVGLQILGSILEKISGKSFETLFAERIAGPLNMKNTDFGKSQVAFPAAGGISTPEDYLKFLVMILNKGTFNNKRILSESSIAQMQVDRITPDVQIAFKPVEAGDSGYGYGEWVMKDGAISSPGLFGSFPWINNDKKYAAFMMSYYLQSSGRFERYQELKKMIDDAVSKN